MLTDDAGCHLDARDSKVCSLSQCAFFSWFLVLRNLRPSTSPWPWIYISCYSIWKLVLQKQKLSVQASRPILSTRHSSDLHLGAPAIRDILFILLLSSDSLSSLPGRAWLSGSQWCLSFFTPSDSGHYLTKASEALNHTASLLQGAPLGASPRRDKQEKIPLQKQTQGKSMHKWNSYFLYNEVIIDLFTIWVYSIGMVCFSATKIIVI